jgi:hypothetical protein
MKNQADLVKQKRVAWFLGLDTVDDLSDANSLIKDQNQNLTPLLELKDINFKSFSGLPTVSIQENKCKAQNSTEIDV